MFTTADLTEIDAYARTPGHGPLTPDDQKEWAWLCQVCRSTLAGNAYLYPGQYQNQPLFALVAWGINHIASLIGPEP
jgi:hypothetical protein